MWFSINSVPKMCMHTWVCVKTSTKRRKKKKKKKREIDVQALHKRPWIIKGEILEKCGLEGMKRSPAQPSKVGLKFDTLLGVLNPTL